MLGRFAKAFGIARGWATAQAPSGPAPGSPDFSITLTGTPTGWGVTTVATLVPSNAPAGAYFVLVGEPAGLAVVNG